MNSWLKNFASLSLRQMFLLWVALTISVNLSPGRSVWVLLIVQGMLYGAVTGFKSAMEWKTKRTAGLVWSSAAGLFSLAAFFAVKEVSTLFFVFLLLYGVSRLGWEILLVPNSTWRIFALAGTDGLLAFMMLFIGINDGSLAQSTRPAVILAGVTFTMLLLVVGLLRDQTSFSGDYFTSIFVLCFSAVSILVFFNTYMSMVYAWPILALVLAAVYFVSPLNSAWQQAALKRKAIFNWLFILTMNAYLFYVFTEHTHILQLIT